MADFLPICVSNYEICQEEAVRACYLGSLPSKENTCKISNLKKLILPYCIDTIEEPSWIKVVGQSGMKLDMSKELVFWDYDKMFKLLFKTDGIRI